jgi:predicted amidophosphoribosyltransferase
MSQDELGYVELEWTCPNCQSRNPGSVRLCANCGSPQPDKVEFHAPERQQLVQDAQKLEDAKAGADIHCPYCGARNKASAETCAQCGGDLKTGLRRESGRVVGAFVDAPAALKPCPRCGNPNPDSAQNCSSCGAPLNAPLQPTPVAAPTPTKPNRLLLIISGVVGVLILCSCVVLAGSYFRTSSSDASVQNASWSRSVAVQALQPVDKEAFRDQIPSDAKIGQCKPKEHHTQDQPAPNSQKVCGTPYTVDQGSGYGKVIQDCKYTVYQDYCSYTVQAWLDINSARLQGSDAAPRWPEPTLQTGQRLGGRQETYTILFKTSDKTYEYTTGDAALFQQARPGSRWKLNINSFGQVMSVEPAN